MEKLLKNLGIDETADAEEIVGKLELKQSEIMERLDNVEDEARRRKLEEDLKQIETAISAFSWMKGKEQTGIAREEEEESEDFSDLKGQSAEAAPVKVQNDKTEEELYDESLAMMATPDYAKGVEMMQSLAESGYARAMLKMGKMHEEGNRVEKDVVKAAEWYRKAAEQGDAKGQCYLGAMYLDGNGVEQDKIKAVEWFRKAAEQGDVYGQINLGVMYEEGGDKVHAMEWYRKSAEQGLAPAQCYLGMSYEEGGDKVHAIEWYRKAAVQGDANAQAKLRELGESY